MCKFLSFEHPLRFAHRGSTILWPENTLKAFQGAAGYGCQYIESDLHMTRDGIIVLFHDDKLERLTNGRGKIKNWDWEDLRRLDAAYYFKPDQNFPLRGKNISIPSLEEAVTAFKNIMFNLDLKQPCMEPALSEFIKKHRLQDRVLITSFNDFRTRRFQKLLKTASSAGIIETALNRIWTGLGGRAYKTRAEAWQVPVKKGCFNVINKRLINAAHKAGIQVHAWTVNEPAEMDRLLKMGVDGIVTDRIDILTRIIDT